MKTHSTTKKLVLTGLLAALTVAGSAIRITVPLDIAGTSSFHLGNIMCALSGIFLGPWLGGLAAGLGSAIYDILLDPAYLAESWITLLTKGAYGLISGLVAYSFCDSWHNAGKKYLRALLATIAGALMYAFLYLSKTCFYSGMLMKGLTLEAALWGTVDKLPATTFNAVVAIVAAPLLATLIGKALKKNHLDL